MLPTSIENLIQSISSLPGIGKKGASKLVLDYLHQETNIQDLILKSFIDVRQQVKKCPTCYFLSEGESECIICKSDFRNESQIMIVNTALDVIPIETNNVFGGKYHVLQNLISPLDNLMPQDTTLYDLEHRIDKFLRNNSIESLELIYFIKHSFAASTTYSYIEDYCLNHKHKSRIKLTKLATGLPTNFTIQSMDQDSFKIAYENRK
ncbi:MAG: hypothetical protein ACRCXZ_04995 [Patescibacteria group bacterium]